MYGSPCSERWPIAAEWVVGAENVPLSSDFGRLRADPPIERHFFSGNLGLAALLPRAEADSVSVGIGQHPERRRLLVADERSTGCQSGIDPRLDLLWIDPDVWMPALPWLLATGPLEPDQG